MLASIEKKMIDYKIIDNLIPISYQNFIDDMLNTNSFPWYFGTSINYNPKNIKYEDENVTDAPGFGHLAFSPETNTENSFIFPHIKPILYFFEEKENVIVKEIKRIRIRRTVQIPGHTLQKYTPPHVDLSQSEDYYSLVYYVDDSDGDTVLFKNKFDEKTGDTVLFKKSEEYVRVPPKKGRGFFFKGKIFHSGNCPVNFKKRTIINFDFTIK